MSSSGTVEAWPLTELEWVRRCPVCGERQRRCVPPALARAVRDSAGPPAWALHTCNGCSSAYIDPRPCRTSVARLQARSPGAPPRLPQARPGVAAALMRALENAYTNQRYGTRYEPSLGPGGLLLSLAVRRRRQIDSRFRWLPKPEAGQRLLDVHCGGGEFLTRASEAGWEAYGIDPDRSAVAAARQRGRNAIVGSVESLTQRIGYFDAITLSQAIGRMHSPLEFLRSAHWLLKPGGVLYLDTPDVQALALGEPGWGRAEHVLPRQLVLFNRNSLLGLLRRTGFVQVRVRPRVAAKNRPASICLTARRQSARGASR